MFRKSKVRRLIKKKSQVKTKHFRIHSIKGIKTPREISDSHLTHHLETIRRLLFQTLALPDHSLGVWVFRIPSHVSTLGITTYNRGLVTTNRLLKPQKEEKYTVRNWNLYQDENVKNTI